MLSRRGFDALAIGAAFGLAAGDTAAQPVGPQIAMVRPRTETLEIACEALGPEGGPAVILLHGFPDDPRAWDGVAPPLAEAGCRVYVPFLRGYGPTRFLATETPRSGEQAALGHDLLALMDALRLPRAVSSATTGAAGPPASSPRCGPSACSASSPAAATTSRTSPPPASPLRRSRSSALVPVLLPDRARPRRPRPNRRGLCRLLWSCGRRPGAFDDATFERDRGELRQSRLRRRRDPFLPPPLRRRTRRPGGGGRSRQCWRSGRSITVPTIALQGAVYGVNPVEGSAGHARSFTGPTSAGSYPMSGASCRMRRRRRMCARYGAAGAVARRRLRGGEWRCCAPSEGDTAKGQTLSSCISH